MVAGLAGCREPGIAGVVRVRDASARSTACGGYFFRSRCALRFSRGSSSPSGSPRDLCWTTRAAMA
ncbi:hypothetical protein NKH18_01485 [Streptomyces sp. M10(2022)]